MTWTLIISNVSSVIVAIASAIVAFYAVSGVNDWRRKFGQETEHKIARNTLENIFRYKDAIDFIRTPGIHPPPVEHKDSAVGEFLGTQTYYYEKFEKLDEISLKLRTALIEAETLWGEDIRRLGNRLMACNVKLRFAYQDFFELKNPDTLEKSRGAILEVLDRSVLFDTGPNNAFSRELKSIIQEIENTLRPKLIVN